MLFTGRLTSDAIVKTVKEERKVTTFVVAVNKRWKDRDGEKHEKTAYVDCAYWINSGVAEFLKKGTVVEISGWVEAQGWLSRDGEAKGVLRCDVEKLTLFTPQKAKEEDTQSNKRNSRAKSNAGKDKDEPF